ncbi:hypothetical protein LTR95_014545 [Oleoguttula sp. CCFEE 5521]
MFAGQLYISSHLDYLEICTFLGLSTTPLTDEKEDQGWKVDGQSFILCNDRGRIGGESGLIKSPADFLKVLLSKIRYNGQGISRTDLGGLLGGTLSNPAELKEEVVP